MSAPVALGSHWTWVSALAGQSPHLKDAVRLRVAIPHYVYKLRERKLAFLRLSAMPGNTPGLPHMSSHLILKHLTSPARQAARQTSLALYLHLQIQVHCQQNWRCQFLWQVPGKEDWGLK